jgi:hypothetical protein
MNWFKKIFTRKYDINKDLMNLINSEQGNVIFKAKRIVELESEQLLFHIKNLIVSVLCVEDELTNIEIIKIDNMYQILADGKLKMELQLFGDEEHSYGVKVPINNTKCKITL